MYGIKLLLHNSGGLQAGRGLKPQNLRKRRSGNVQAHLIELAYVLRVDLQVVRAVSGL
jgi:hypothetical protein